MADNEVRIIDLPVVTTPAADDKILIDGASTRAITIDNFLVAVGSQPGPPNALAIGTVASGASASATITGASPSQTLNLILPKGDTGATGPTGPTGPSGAVGVSGTPTVNQIAAWVDGTTVKGVSITGLVKGNGVSAPAAAVAGTDYLAPPSGSTIQKANSGGALVNAVAGTDYIAPPAGTALLKANSGGALANAAAGTDYLAPPAGTSILKGNSSGALANATAGTDYLAPPSGSALLKANSGGALANATAGTDYLDKATTSTITAGYTITSNGLGSVTGSGQTVTPNIATRGFQDCTLNGSSLTGTLTWAAPSNGPGVVVVEVVNGGSGAVGATLSTSGYTKVTGDTWASTNGNKYLFWSTSSKNYTHLHIQALQ